jgi:hypothetical protein
LTNFIVSAPNSARLFLALAWIYVGLCTLSILWLQMRGSVPFIQTDELSWWKLLWSAYEGHFRSKEIFAAHNSHPIWTTKLIAWVQMRTGIPWNASHYLYTAMSLAMVFYIAHMAKIRGLAGPRLAVLIVVAASLLLTAKHNENLYWMIQIAFCITIFASLIAFDFADRYYRAPTRSSAFIAGLAAFVALVSLGSGLITWALTLAVLALAKPNKKRLLVIGILFFLGAALYPYSARLEPIVYARPPVAPVLDMAAYWLSLMANSVWIIDTRTTTTAARFVGALITLGVFVAVLRHWHNEPPQRGYVGHATQTAQRSPLVLCLILFTLACVALITYSRAVINQPDASRYAILLVPMLLGVFWHALSFDRSRYSARLAAVGAVALVAMTAWHFKIEWTISVYRYEYYNRAWAKLCSGERNYYPGAMNPYQDEGFDKLRIMSCQPRPDRPAPQWKMVPEPK